jgi:hypothetical protein
MLYPINKTSNMWSAYHHLVLMYKLQQIHIPRRDLEEEQWLIRLLSRSTPKTATTERGFRRKPTQIHRET